MHFPFFSSYFSLLLLSWNLPEHNGILHYLLHVTAFYPLIKVIVWMLWVGVTIFLCLLHARKWNQDSKEYNNNNNNKKWKENRMEQFQQSIRRILARIHTHTSCTAQTHQTTPRSPGGCLPEWEKWIAFNFHIIPPVVVVIFFLPLSTIHIQRILVIFPFNILLGVSYLYISLLWHGSFALQ